MIQTPSQQIMWKGWKIFRDVAILENCEYQWGEIWLTPNKKNHAHTINFVGLVHFKVCSMFGTMLQRDHTNLNGNSSHRKSGS